ncbi:MAG TPA: methyl-accepting chemotaxis protein [Acidimicrobiales bacterium]|nr:methyl-accepting chemotaxis protein [Acidimicrobiales bacterium]
MTAATARIQALGPKSLEPRDYEAQVLAIRRSQAVIEFAPDGTILDANDKFLDALGYRLEEVKGRHHRIFVPPEEATSRDYERFWSDLRAGEYRAARFRRIGKGGREVWIQASYNPVLTDQGQVKTVVKFATDVTDQVRSEERLRDGVEHLLEIVSAAAQGDLTRQVVLEGDDAIGRLAGGLEVLLSSLRETIVPVAESAKSLAAASTTLLEAADRIGGAAERTSVEAGVASAAAEQISANVATVAASSEEMGASIKEIARNTAEAAATAAKAVDMAEATTQTVGRLGQSSAEIGKIVRVITSIAQQTNLLALNATIEAARAGAAGRGFAVVANEVKELARKTAQATEDIGVKIEAIQANTGAAVEVIGAISGTIQQIAALQQSVASAVEEQAATTAEIARNVGESSEGTSGIAASISSVAATAEQTSAAAAGATEAATDLAAMAKNLQALVAKFHY